ncbi:MAG: flagellar basal body rod protein FlgB [bacterium]|nr:flagellar basal body rod protein FlgB [bacterium]
MISREVRGLERAMDALSMRFQATAENLANVNTPGYKRHEVSFEAELAEAIDSPPPPGSYASGNTWAGLLGPDGESPDDSLEQFTPATHRIENQSMRVDGNGTSLEAEMSHLLEANERFNTVATQIAAQYRTFKYITDQK